VRKTPSPFSVLPRLTLLGVVLAAFLTPLRAQVLVDLSVRRSIYVAYEPLLATVRIKNLSGNTLLLSDMEGKKWFGFQIETLDGRPIPPNDPNYEIPPMQVPNGQSIAREVNLTQLYPITDPGSYRIRATIHSPELGYFSSPPITVEITEGRLLWQQRVGVPAAPGESGENTRTISLLSHRLADRTDLYLRIENKASGIVYCTHRLGDYISFGKPDVLLDSVNAIHVLQNSAPRTFIYSKVGLDGKILDRRSYKAPKDRPFLQRSPDGGVLVVGGVPFDPKAGPPPVVFPKLSDRPVPLPTVNGSPEPLAKPKGPSAAGPTPGKRPHASPTPGPAPSSRNATPD
jgi:hypothetical protein